MHHYYLYALLPAILFYCLIMLLFGTPISFFSFLLILFILFSLCFIYYQFFRLKKNSLFKKKIFYYTLFYIYIIFMIHFLFLSSEFARDPTYMIHTDYYSALSYQWENGTNFTPFETIHRMFLIFDLDYIDNKVALINLVGNFIAFMPFSFFAVTLFHKHFKNPFLYLIIISLIVIFVEVLQLFTLTGSCDIDDFILNVSGSLLCYFILRLTQKKC